jgi:hypothetical protein
VITAPHQIRQQRAADAPADFVAGDHSGDQICTAHRLLLRQGEDDRDCRRSGMTAALIVVVVELTALGKCSVHEHRVVDRHPIAVFHDRCRPAAFRVFDEFVHRLIPRHAGADQLTTQLIEQQFPAAPHGLGGDRLVAQVTDKRRELLRRRGLQIRSMCHCPSRFCPLPRRVALVALVSAASLPSLWEISAAILLTSSTSLFLPFACSLNGVNVIVRE